MPRPSTGHKIIWAGPNVLCQSKRWFAFRKFSVCAGTKSFAAGLNTIQFLVWSPNILGLVEGQGINLLSDVFES